MTTKYQIACPSHGYVCENLGDAGTGEIRISAVAEQVVDQEIEQDGKRFLLSVKLEMASKRFIGQRWGARAWEQYPHVVWEDGDVTMATEAFIAAWDDDLNMWRESYPFSIERIELV